MNGEQLSTAWALPFAGTLLSIALLPLLAPRLWHHHFGKITAGWIMAFLVPWTVFIGPKAAVGVIGHVLIEEYIPFIALLVALYTAAGGIHIRGNLHGSPTLNVVLMAIGAALASVMGTTGASMLMIRPLLRANDNRPHSAHVVVFFIFIVSNVGGALTPLGDPPLFLGFLQGVGFFWTVGHLLAPMLFLTVALLVIFWCIDTWFYRREGITPRDPTPDTQRIGIEGGINFLPLMAIVGLVLMSGLWKPGVTLHLLGAHIGLEQLIRDVALVGVTLLSLWITPAGVRDKNQFGWGPMQEVAKLFIGIFITMVPVLVILRAGEAGSLGAVARAVTGPDGAPQPWMYFWLTGVLSSFLDNAPTYLVFFNLAGGDPEQLMTTLGSTLAAISAGSVFMGANTYLGNAPNFMVKAIAEERGIRMPSFFGYMAWSACVLLPLLVFITFIWFT